MCYLVIEQSLNQNSTKCNFNLRTSSLWRRGLQNWKLVTNDVSMHIKRCYFERAARQKFYSYTNEILACNWSYEILVTVRSAPLKIPSFSHATVLIFQRFCDKIQWKSVGADLTESSQDVKVLLFQVSSLSIRYFFFADVLKWLLVSETLAVYGNFYIVLVGRSHTWLRFCKYNIDFKIHAI